MNQHELLLLVLNALLSGLAARLFIKRGPRGAQGYDGMPGPPGMMGAQGKSCKCHGNCECDEI